MENLSPKDLILKTLKEKASLKQDVYAISLERFNQFKKALEQLVKEISAEMAVFDKRVKVTYSDKGEFEAHVVIGGDLLVFHFHTNVFLFDNDHPLWKTSYVKEDGSRAYCGIINVFNFLNDSFKYNRDNDMGYLIARIFINKENHFMVQGKRQLGFLYNDFINAELTQEYIKAVCESIILYAIDFDLYIPPYDLVKEVTVQEIKAISDNLQLKTGKRLGFKFQADTDDL
jgi:hypothetical protein